MVKSYLKENNSNRILSRFEYNWLAHILKKEYKNYEKNNGFSSFENSLNYCHAKKDIDITHDFLIYAEIFILLHPKIIIIAVLY